MPSSGIISGTGPGGAQIPLRATPAGALETDAASGSGLEQLLRELIYEVRLLRLGLIAANDSVCTDVEGDLTPVTTSEE